MGPELKPIPSFCPSPFAKDLLLTLRSYCDSTVLSSLLQSKLNPSVLSLTSEVTAECALLRGYALGQANGQVSVFLPPCGKSVSVFEAEEIVALVSFDDFLLVFAGNRFAEMGLDSLEVEEPGTLEGTVTAAAPALGDNKVLIGFSEGLIWEYQEDGGSLQKSTTSYESLGSVSILEAGVGQNWFLACCFDGQEHFLVWRYGCSVPLYRLSRSYDVSVMPSAIDTETLIPDNSYKVVIEGSQVSLLAMKDKDTLEDSFVLNLQRDGTATVVEMDKWEYICRRSRAEGKAVFRYEGSVVILGFTESWLKAELAKDAELRLNVLCVEIGFEYQTTGTSEDGLYQFLISYEQTQALFLGSVETTFTHAYSHNDSELSASSVLHRRFSALHNAFGDPVMDLDPQRNYRFSPELNYLCTWTQNNTDWQFICLEDKSIRHQSDEVPITLFSSFDETVVLLYRTSVLVLGMNYITKESVNCTVEVSGLGDSRLFWKPEKWLFVFRPDAKATKLDASPRLVQLSVERNFECLTDSDPSSMDFIAGYKDKTVYYSWTEENLTVKASSLCVYTDLKAFGKGQYCAATADRQCDILQLPTLDPLMTFRPHIQLGLSPLSETFFTYSEVPGQSYLSLSYWNLALGIPVQSLDLGLALIPSLPQSDRLDRYPQSLKVIEGLWRIPSEDIGPVGKELVFLGAEYLPAYCTAVRRLSQLLTKEAPIPLSDLLTRLVISPCQVNILHLFVLQGEPDLISEAMALGAKFQKGYFGTPITICLNAEEKSSTRDECCDQLLDGLIALSDSNPMDFLIALHFMDTDFPLLLKCESAFLASFLQTILVPLPKEFIVKSPIGVGDILPLSDLWPDLKPHKPSWRLKQYFTGSAGIVPVLRVCPIPLSMELRKNELLDVLKDVDSSKDILGQEVITHLANAKWREISVAMKLWTVLYWALLVLVVERVYGYGEERSVQIGLLVLNTVLILIEIWQAATGDWMDYVSSPWNWADWVRFVLTYIWTFAAPSLALTFPTIFLNAFIGLTTFEAFSQTRFLVRMILKVCVHTVYFVLIFVYSNVTFGVLCAVTDDTAEMSFYESWTTGFEMSMGNFDNSGVSTLRWFVFFAACLVNMVWLLNLIVSLLGTAYEDFTTAVQAEDVKAQFERVYQLESMVKCLNNTQGSKSYLQVYSKKKPSCNPREEQVTLYSLRQEMQEQMKELREGMKVLLARTASQPGPNSV